MQDHYADAANFTQTVDLAILRIGEAALQLLRYGAGEARISGALRADGILRGLGGLYAGTFTTTQRNAIVSGLAPGGIIVNNLTTGQLEWNAGSDAVRNWQPIALNSLGQLALNDVFIKRLTSNVLQLDAISVLARSFTTAQRDAISAGQRPEGGTIWNSDTKRYEYNAGNDASPSWSGFGAPDLYLGELSIATNALTDLVNYTVKGGALGTNRKVVMEFFGDLTQHGATTANLTLSALFGGVEFWKDTIALANVIGRRIFRIRLEVANTGAANSNAASGHVDVASASAPTTGLGSLNDPKLIDAPIGSGLQNVNTVLDQVLRLTAQWSITSINAEIRRHSAVVRII